MNISKIKTWHFSLGAVIIQAVFLTYWVIMSLDTPLPNPNDDLSSINGVPSLFAGFSLAILVLLLIPTILLKTNTDKSRKLGTILSRIFGVIATGYVLLVLIGHLRFRGPINLYIILYGLQILQAYFLFAASRLGNIIVSK